jgi:hypothetical protein
MKKLILLFVLCCPLTRAALRTNVTLVWDYPAAELSPDLTFKLYYTTNVALPTASWSLYTNVVGTNLHLDVPITSQARWFTLTASNVIGEGDFSNAALTAPPRSGTLRIQ